MPESSRLFNCQRCHKQVIICTQCDRGNRYCPDGCAEKARADSLKRAAIKYQQSRQGKHNNALSQKRHRARQKEKVTHQGSAPIRRYVVLRTEPVSPSIGQNKVPSTAKLHCHFCGCACQPYLRAHFLITGRFHRSRSRHKSAADRVYHITGGHS